MKRIVICDDDIESAEEIKNLLDEYLSNNKTDVETLYYHSSEDFLENYDNKQSVDIAILDVIMGNLNGIQLCYEIRNRYPNAVIMIATSFPDYIDAAMDLKIFRFFEKPIDRVRFYKAMDIALKEKNAFSIETKTGAIILKEDDIAYITIKMRNTEIRTSTGKLISSTMKIKDWLKLLENNNTFAVPHYSYIVNLNYIRKFETDHIIIECKNGAQFKIYPSRRKYPEFKIAYNEKMREFK